jgi:hypothetical protein
MGPYDATMTALAQGCLIDRTAVTMAQPVPPDANGSPNLMISSPTSPIAVRAHLLGMASGGTLWDNLWLTISKSAYPLCAKPSEKIANGV